MVVVVVIVVVVVVVVAAAAVVSQGRPCYAREGSGDLGAILCRSIGIWIYQ